MDNTEIYKLLELQSDSINKTIRYGLKGIRVYVDAGFESIDKADKIRNGRLNKVEEDTQTIGNDTGLWRWMHRNPLKAAGVAVLFISLVAFGLHKIDFNQTLVNTTGVSIRSNETTTVTNEIN